MENFKGEQMNDLVEALSCIIIFIVFSITIYKMIKET